MRGETASKGRENVLKVIGKVKGIGLIYIAYNTFVRTMNDIGKAKIVHREVHHEIRKKEKGLKVLGIEAL